MFNHTKVYKSYFNLGPYEHHYCEVCGLPASGGVHHLEKRGEGKDIIELLMGLCSKHHHQCEMSPDCNEYAKMVHKSYLLCNPYQHPEMFNELIFKRQCERMDRMFSFH